VGGPVTCHSAWLADFIKFCVGNNVPYDFIATHEYPTDENPSNRNIMKQVMTESRATVGPDALLFYSEFNDGLYSNPAYHDTPYASSFLFHVLHDVQGLVDLLSWWTFTDIFEEQGQSSIPFFNTDGWGLQNQYKVPKPAYRAFQLLHNLGTEELAVATTSNTTTGVWSILNNQTLDIVFYNYDLPDSTIQNQSVVITLTNLATLPTYGTILRIDESNSNAPAVWLAQGSPAYPTPLQIQDQIQASLVIPQNISAQKVSSSSVQFTVEVPAWGSGVISVAI